MYNKKNIQKIFPYNILISCGTKEECETLNYATTLSYHGTLTIIFQFIDFKDCLAKESSKMAFVKKIFYLAALLVMSQVSYKAEAKQCSKQNQEASKFGMMLQRHTFKRITTPSYVCLRECRLDLRCQSFNYVISKEMCELNNRTREARPEDFVPDPDRYYIKRDMDRGK